MLKKYIPIQALWSSGKQQDRTLNRASLTTLFLVFFIGPTLLVSPPEVFAASLSENESSIVLVTNSWEALNSGDFIAAREWAKKCIDRYGIRARQMQEKLDGFVAGTELEIRSHWALNDVATALFIQGLAYQKDKMFDAAKASYLLLLEQYAFGQCWDPKGWFWKPSDVAKENLAMIESGVFFDFGDYSSETLVTRAWEALEKEDLDRVIGYADKCIVLYQDKAREIQKGLKGYPEGSDEDLYSFWALNDVATAHFIKGQAYMVSGKSEEALREFEKVRHEYYFGQCWDPRGWFWKPADAAKNWIDVLDEKKKTENFLFKI